MTSELPETATATQTDAALAKRRTKRTRRASSARRAAQGALGAQLRMKKGERRELTPQPPGPQPGALTIELRPP